MAIQLVLRLIAVFCAVLFPWICHGESPPTLLSRSTMEEQCLKEIKLLIIGEYIVCPPQHYKVKDVFNTDKDSTFSRRSCYLYNNGKWNFFEAQCKPLLQSHLSQINGAVDATDFSSAVSSVSITRQRFGDGLVLRFVKNASFYQPKRYPVLNLQRLLPVTNIIPFKSATKISMTLEFAKAKLHALLAANGEVRVHYKYRTDPDQSHQRDVAGSQVTSRYLAANKRTRQRVQLKRGVRFDEATISLFANEVDHVHTWRVLDIFRNRDPYSFSSELLVDFVMGPDTGFKTVGDAPMMSTESAHFICEFVMQIGALFRRLHAYRISVPRTVLQNTVFAEDRQTGRVQFKMADFGGARIESAWSESELREFAMSRLKKAAIELIGKLTGYRNMDEKVQLLLQVLDTFDEERMRALSQHIRDYSPDWDEFDRKVKAVCKHHAFS